jgi:hypothetical protein
LTTDYVAPSGQSYVVAAGGDVQAALDGAACGGLAKLVSPNAEPALKTAPGARGYRVLGLEITVASSVNLNWGIVLLGVGTEQTVSELPQEIVLDRVYIHGHSGLDVKRCVALNGVASAVIDSYLAECHYRGLDAQAILGWNGPGPFKIVNNYLEGSGENVMFGGADPKIDGLIPSDIEIRRNHFYKPLAWQAEGWSVKNLFEIKNGQRVLFEGNVLENNWVHAQNGFAVLFQALTDNNTAPWVRVRDITFRFNRISYAAAGINVLARVAYPSNGRAPVLPTEPAMRIEFSHNVLDRIGVDPHILGSNGRLVQLLGDHQHVVVTHNTGFSTYAALMLAGAGKVGTVYRDNVVAKGSHGVAGDGAGEGTTALTAFDPALFFAGNIVHGGVTERLYPPDNYYPATVGDVGFMNQTSGDYRLNPTSPYSGLATDRSDAGADIAAVEAATAGVVQ